MAGHAHRAFAGFLFVVVSAWLVRQEGASYRAELRASGPDERMARLIPNARPGFPIAGEPVKDSDADPPSNLSATNPSVALAPTARPPVPGPKSRPKSEPTPEPEPAASPPIAYTIPKPPPAPTSPSSHLPEIREVEIDKDPRNWTLEEERRVGEALHETILVRHPTIGRGEELGRLKRVARPLLADRRRKDLDLTFTVLDAPEASAFSHPGGFIYATTGLFSLVADDTELQFVVAHEIAHLDQRHAIEEIARTQGAGGNGRRDLVKRLYYQIALGYSERQDFEADGWAVQELKKLGKTPYQSTSFLYRLAGYAERNEWAWGGERPETGPNNPVQDLANHWPAHPAVADRLDRFRPARAEAR